MTAPLVWAPPPKEEQDRLAAPVLRAALALVRSGWCRSASAVDASGRECLYPKQRPVAWSLYGAVAEHGGIEAEYARRVLRRLLFDHDLVAWNNFPTRKRGEVLALLERAVKVASGRAQHKGGWSVSAGVVQ